MDTAAPTPAATAPVPTVPSSFPADSARTGPPPLLPPALRDAYGRPWLFYLLAIAIPWALWLGAGWLSRRPDAAALEGVVAVLGAAGLVAPAVVAAAFVLRRADLRRDVAARLLPGRTTAWWTLPAAALLLPGSLLIATAISIPLGGDIEQFLPRGGFSFSSGLLPAWFVLAGAAVLEELAWHSYGTDALLTRWSLLRTSVVFGIFWVTWHAPLAGIRGYYQAEVVDEGWATGLNFVVSIFAFVLLMNWVYAHSGRCIGIAVLFHLAANFGNEVLRTDPGTKIIQTAVLIVLCAAVLWKDRALFLARAAPRKARSTRSRSLKAPAHEPKTPQH